VARLRDGRTKMSLRRRLDPDVMQRVELIERAAAEPWQRRLAEEQGVLRVRRAQLRAARRQVAELEGMGPGDALRFALGQALRRRRRRGPEGDHPA
jgi:hypothetical protein